MIRRIGLTKSAWNHSQQHGKRCLYRAIMEFQELMKYNTIQYNTIQYNTIQYNTIQYNIIQYNTIQYKHEYYYSGINPVEC